MASIAMRTPNGHSRSRRDKQLVPQMTKLIESFLGQFPELAELTFEAVMHQQIRASGDTKGVCLSVRDDDPFAVILGVQPGNNKTRREVHLVVPKGMTKDQLKEILSATKCDDADPANAGTGSQGAQSTGAGGDDQSGGKGDEQPPLFKFVGPSDQATCDLVVEIIKDLDGDSEPQWHKPSEIREKAKEFFEEFDDQGFGRVLGFLTRGENPPLISKGENRWVEYKVVKVEEPAPPIPTPDPPVEPIDGLSRGLETIQTLAALATQATTRVGEARSAIQAETARYEIKMTELKRELESAEAALNDPSMEKSKKALELLKTIEGFAEQDEARSA